MVLYFYCLLSLIFITTLRQGSDAPPESQQKGFLLVVPKTGVRLVCKAREAFLLASWVGFSYLFFFCFDLEDNWRWKSLLHHMLSLPPLN